MNTNNNFVIKGHQGDVQFVSVQDLPTTSKKIEKQPVALGEHSGHQHVITGDYDLYQEENFLYADIKEGGAILQHIHESNFKNFDTQEVISKADHHPITKSLKPNTIYKIGIHKKYNPFLKVWEQVID